MYIDSFAIKIIKIMAVILSGKVFQSKVFQSIPKCSKVKFSKVFQSIPKYSSREWQLLGSSVHRPLV